MGDTLDDRRKKLDDEFIDVRKGLDDIRAAFGHLEAAGPEDDISGMLDTLEDVVGKVKGGGLFGSGAKGHRKALEAYKEAKAARRMPT